jgi:hypothetical protein
MTFPIIRGPDSKSTMPLKPRDNPPHFATHSPLKTRISQFKISAILPGLMRFKVLQTRARSAILTATAVASLLGPRNSAGEKPPSAAELVRILNTDGDDQKRLAALHSLEKTSPPDAKQITRSLADTSPEIRVEVIRLALPFLAGDPELQIRLLALCNDRSEAVRLQLLKFIRHFSHPSKQKSLLRILTLQVVSPEGALAASRTIQGAEWETLKLLLANPDFGDQTNTNGKILGLLTAPIAKLPENIMESLDFIAGGNGVPPQLQAAVLRGIRPAERDIKLPLPRKPASLAALRSSTNAELSEAAKQLESHLVWPEFPQPSE